jgi:hypothetical protein
MIHPFYVLDQLTIIRSVEYSLHAASEQSIRSTFPNSIFVLEFPESSHATSFSPLPFFPTSQTPQTAQTVPLYLE